MIGNEEQVSRAVRKSFTQVQKHYVFTFAFISIIIDMYWTVFRKLTHYTQCWNKADILTPLLAIYMFKFTTVSNCFKYI